MNSGSSEVTDLRDDPNRVTYTKEVTQRGKNEVTESAMWVTQSPAVWKRDIGAAYAGFTTSKEERYADVYINQKAEGIKKMPPADAPIIMRFRFWDNNRFAPDGTRLPYKEIEKNIRGGRPGADTWVWNVDTEGLTDNLGFYPGSGGVGKWSVEKPTIFNPLTPASLKRFPEHSSETIVRPVKPYNIPTFPPRITIIKKPQLSIPKSIPPPPDICLACYFYLSNAHFIRDMTAVVNWLNDNPDYNLELIVDGNGKTGENWSSTYGKITLWDRVRDFFIQFCSNINKYSNGKNFGNKLRLTPGKPDGVFINVHPLLIN